MDRVTPARKPINDTPGASAVQRWNDADRAAEELKIRSTLGLADGETLVINKSSTGKILRVLVNGKELSPEQYAKLATVGIVVFEELYDADEPILSDPEPISSEPIPPTPLSELSRTRICTLLFGVTQGLDRPGANAIGGLEAMAKRKLSERETDLLVSLLLQAADEIAQGHHVAVRIDDGPNAVPPGRLADLLFAVAKVLFDVRRADTSNIATLRTAYDALCEEMARQGNDPFTVPLSDPDADHLAPVSNAAGEFADDLRIALLDTEQRLLKKNERYGDSALNPIRAISRLDSIEGIKIRIDDKISRLMRGEEDEDVEEDLRGYFILLKIARARAAQRAARGR